MKLTCTACIDGTHSCGEPCLVCGGDGEIDLLDADFVKVDTHGKLRGIIWDAILTRIDDSLTKLETLAIKVDTLDTHLDVIESKIDELE